MSTLSPFLSSRFYIFFSFFFSLSQVSFSPSSSSFVSRLVLLRRDILAFTRLASIRIFRQQMRLASFDWGRVEVEKSHSEGILERRRTRKRLRRTTTTTTKNQPCRISSTKNERISSRSIKPLSNIAPKEKKKKNKTEKKICLKSIHTDENSKSVLFVNPAYRGGIECLWARITGKG